MKADRPRSTLANLCLVAWLVFLGAVSARDDAAPEAIAKLVAALGVDDLPHRQEAAKKLEALVRFCAAK